jgi:hypothetical protein
MGQMTYTLFNHWREVISNKAYMSVSTLHEQLQTLEADNNCIR